MREFFCLDEPPALSDTAEESRVIKILCIYVYSFGKHQFYFDSNYLNFI